MSTELTVIGLRLFIDGFFLESLINNIIRPIKWMLLYPSRTYFLKYSNSCWSPLVLEAISYSIPIGSRSQDNAFKEISCRPW